MVRVSNKTGIQEPKIPLVKVGAPSMGAPAFLFDGLTCRRDSFGGAKVTFFSLLCHIVRFFLLLIMGFALFYLIHLRVCNQQILNKFSKLFL